MTRAILLLALLLLSGCETQMNKPGGTAEEFRRDLYECKKDAVSAPTKRRYENMVDECLAMKGWREQ